MGWVTNIIYADGMDVGGIKIESGHTQVRWDFGIGDISIDKDGKIIDVFHCCPFDDKINKPRYEKMLSNFTGLMDTNDGYLLVINGQVTSLELFGRNSKLGDFINCRYTTSHQSFKDPKGNELSKRAQYSSLTDLEGEELTKAVKLFISKMKLPLRVNLFHDEAIDKSLSIYSDKYKGCDNKYVNELRELYQTGKVKDGVYF